jgi:hypothetical protein
VALVVVELKVIEQQFVKLTIVVENVTIELNVTNEHIAFALTPNVENVLIELKAFLNFLTLKSFFPSRPKT